MLGVAGGKEKPVDTILVGTTVTGTTFLAPTAAKFLLLLESAVNR